MKISLLHPSRNRVAMAGEAIAEWLGKRSGLHPVEYILSIDRDDDQLAGYGQLAERYGARLIVHRNRSYVQAANQAARAATGDLLVQNSDDFGCPDAWDDALVQALVDRRDVAVLVDDRNGIRTMTLPIVDRVFYQQRGYLLYPGYHHMFSDNDLEQFSRRRGKLLEATHLQFPHRHYSTGARDCDAIYNHGGSRWELDQLLFNKRRVCDFGVRPRTMSDIAKCALLNLDAAKRLASILFRRMTQR